MITTRKSKYKYKVTMPSNWDNGHDEMIDWCTQSFGTGGRHKKFRWRFGLPGEKFEAHANVNYMDFLFDSKLDAMIMCLKWNARIVSEDELTVESVGKMMI